MGASNTKETTFLPLVNQTYKVGMKIPMPVDVEILSKLPRGYSGSNYVLDGYQNGFSLKFKGPQITTVFKNPDIVSNMLNNELKKGRIAGPCSLIR